MNNVQNHKISLTFRIGQDNQNVTCKNFWTFIYLFIIYLFFIFYLFIYYLFIIHLLFIYYLSIIYLFIYLFNYSVI